MKQFLKEYIEWMNINSPQKKTLVRMFFLVIIFYPLINVETWLKIIVIVSALGLVGFSMLTFYIEDGKRRKNH